jgi:hypothetical protein
MVEFLVETSGKVLDISNIVAAITFTDKLNDGCSKLEFSFIDDDVKIENSAYVRFRYNDANIFYGRVFKWSRGSDKAVNVTAYDMLRYAKAKDVIVSQGETVSTLTRRMCNYLGLPLGDISDTGYILPTSVEDSKTWLDIIYPAISDTLTNKEKWYCLRDEFGSVCLRDINDLKLNLVLGDESLCYGYEYEKSIDEDFYNYIKIYIKGKDSNTVGSFAMEKDDASITKYGLLQYFETMDNANASQAKSKSEALLRLYNREAETLSLECFGDVSVRAGNSIYASMKDISIDRRLIVKSATHSYIPFHKMSLEVAL